MTVKKHPWISARDIEVLHEATWKLRNLLQGYDPTHRDFTRLCRQCLKEHDEKQESIPATDYYVGLVNCILMANSIGQVEYIISTTVPPGMVV